MAAPGHYSHLLITLFAAAFLAGPADAITTVGDNPNSLAVGYDTSVDGVNLSGVVMIDIPGVGNCTGSLLSDGTSILTAAHCVDNPTYHFLASAATITVSFQGPNGFVNYQANALSVDPAYTGDSTQGGDLAVIQLGALAPAFATRYQLDMEPATTATDVIAGYGEGGTGADGADPAEYPFGTLRAGENQYVVNGSAVGWSSSLLLGQFYESGDPSTNVLEAGYPFSAADEVDIAEGDSGGPTFQDGEIVGVHDVIACDTDGCNPNSSFGDIFGDTSVYSNLAWIEEAEAPEPRTFALMVGALLALLLLGVRPAAPADTEFAPRQRRKLRGKKQA